MALKHQDERLCLFLRDKVCPVNRKSREEKEVCSSLMHLKTFSAQSSPEEETPAAADLQSCQSNHLCGGKLRLPAASALRRGLTLPAASVPSADFYKITETFIIVLQKPHCHESKLYSCLYVSIKRPCLVLTAQNVS